MRLLIFFLLFTASAAAQQPRNYIFKDSLSYYQNQVSAMRRAAYDSVSKQDAYQSALLNIARLKTKSKDYAAFSLFGEFCHANYNTFNNSIFQSGFPALKPWLPRIGFGFSSKKGRRMFDFAYGIIGLGSRVKKDKEKISANFSSLFQFEWGYSIVNADNFNLYPYAGFSLRQSTLVYDKPILANNNATNITGFIQNNTAVTLNSGQLGYQAGIAMECNIGSTEDNAAGTLLFVKAGVSNAFTKEKYCFGGIKYVPEIRQGDWLVSLGFKFFGKR
jgi:hypothetical protein